jgi:hypothetical protein
MAPKFELAIRNLDVRAVAVPIQRPLETSGGVLGWRTATPLSPTPRGSASSAGMKGCTALFGEVNRKASRAGRRRRRQLPTDIAQECADW